MRLCKDFTTLEQIQKGVEDKIVTGESPRAQ